MVMHLLGYLLIGALALVLGIGLGAGVVLWKIAKGIEEGFRWW